MVSSTHAGILVENTYAAD